MQISSELLELGTKMEELVSIKALNRLLWSQPPTVDLNNKYFKLFNVVVDQSEQEAYYDQTPLQWACAYGKVKMIEKLLLFQQAYPSPLFKRNLARAMLAACKYNRLTSVKMIDTFASAVTVDVNFSTMGTTPFLYACMKRRVAFVKLYLDRANIRDALRFAVTVKNNQQVIDLLVDAGMSTSCSKLDPRMLMTVSHSTNIEHLVNSVPGCSQYLQDAFDHILATINNTDENNELSNKMSNKMSSKDPSRGEYLNRLDIISEFIGKDRVIVTSNY